MAQVRTEGTLYEIVLSNEDVANAELAAAVLAATPVGPVVVALAGAVKLFNELGGRRGVKVVGTTLSGAFALIGPASLPLFETAKAGISKVTAWVSSNPEAAAALAVGGPLALPFVIVASVFSSAPDRTRLGGSVRASRDAAGEWEKFALVPLPESRFALKAHTGFLRAADEPSFGDVYFDRQTIDVHEQWILEAHPMGGVAIKSVRNDRYLCAIDGGGSHCVADRPSPPKEWEQFHLEFNADCTLSIKSRNGNYITATPEGSI